MLRVIIECLCVQEMLDKTWMRNPSFFLQRCSGRIKALYWDETGYVQLYKCLMEKRFQWSRNESELKEFTQHEFRGLMKSLSIIQTLEILCSWGRIYVLSVGLSEVYNFLMCLYPFYIYCHIMSVYRLCYG